MICSVSVKRILEEFLLVKATCGLLFLFQPFDRSYIDNPGPMVKIMSNNDSDNNAHSIFVAIVLITKYTSLRLVKH